jgi:hypothetical protein
MPDPISIETIHNALIEIRGQQVLRDSDVARIYGVQTKRINEAVRNNPDKFPKGYLLELTDKEWNQLRSKISTTNTSMIRSTPKAFTEKGLYMLATILKSKQATQATLTIIETFAKLRELGHTMAALSNTDDEPTQNTLMHHGGHLFADLFNEHLQTSDSETSVELNFAVVRFRHSIKRKR